MNEIILVIVVITALLIVLTTLIYYVIKRVNLLMKSIFLDKLSQLDFLSEEKENKISELNKEISLKEENINELESKIEEYKKFETKSKENDVILPKYADFEDGNLLSNYKIVKEKFDFNIEEILSKLVKENKSNINDEKKYLLYKNVKSYFTYDVIYKLETYQKDEQYLLITNLLNNEEKKFLSKYLVKEKFNLKKFISKIDELLIKSNPKIVVYVGDKNKNYNSIDSRIETIYDENIMEGFKIFYKGIVYDYSI